jgi:3-dehydroquinate dehydratase/shikimate dehydrogenase
MLAKYRPYIDLAELRVDCLSDDERLLVRPFPRLAGLPVILTVRREKDGGCWKLGEASRMVTLGRALAHAEADPRANFAYLDIEDDVDSPSIEEAARAFGTRVIRSFHNISGTEPNLLERIEGLSHAGDEILKAVIKPSSFNDVVELFKAAKSLSNREKILIAMGNEGASTRILSPILGSSICFAAVKGENDFAAGAPGQFDPVELTEIYRIKNITKKTKIFGITGWPLAASGSPEIHNKFYKDEGRNAVYVPFPTDSLESFMFFANEIGLAGFSVTVPYKEKVLMFASESSERVKKIGASNTFVRRSFVNGRQGWSAHNTDAPAFSDSLLHLVFGEELAAVSKLKRMKVMIIGAGGAAKAVAGEVHALGAKALILNRTQANAKELAQKYGFKWGGLGERDLKAARHYSDIIIQTSPVGMTDGVPGDPFPLYEFSGGEIVFDIIYKPEETPFLKRARDAGCVTMNGKDMLLRQAALQHKIFFG